MKCGWKKNLLIIIHRRGIFPFRNNLSGQQLNRLSIILTEENMSGASYVFAQFLNLLPRYEFQSLVNKHKGDYRTRHFKCWNQMACHL